MVMVPVLVKEGVVPDWLTVRLPPLTLMVPLLTWSAEAWLRVRSGLDGEGALVVQLGRQEAGKPPCRPAR